MSMRNRDAERPAGAYPEDRIREGIFEEDDEKIAGAYRGNERLLESLRVLSNNEQNRVALACQRVQALADLREALARELPHEIVRVFLEHADVLEPSRNFRGDERQRVVEAKRSCRLNELRVAIQANDVYWIEQAGQRAIDDGCQLSDIEYGALQRARHTVLALRQLEQAIGSDDDVAIADVYRADLLDDCRYVTPHNRERVRLAQDRLQRWYPLRRALAKGDDLGIVSVYDRSLFDGFRLLSPEHRERCELALKRAEAFQRLQRACLANDPRSIVEAYDENLLDACTLLTPRQRQRIADARYQVILVKAWKSGDRMRIADAYQAMMRAHISMPAGLDRQAVVEVARQVELIEELREALHSLDRHDEDIVRLGDRLLERWPDLSTAEERDQILRSKVKIGARSRLQQAAASGDNQRVSIVHQHLLSLVGDAAATDPNNPSCNARQE
jgi:hypothetical protein